MPDILAKNLVTTLDLGEPRVILGVISGKTLWAHL
jgi:hypothetical protein